jgi:hypothetical protein
MMEIDLSRFTPYDKRKRLPDMYMVLVVVEHTMGTETFKNLDVAIHLFSKQVFMSKGEVLTNVIAYAEYKLV